MTLSVVIVNYNVKYFLEQCLISVFKSMEGIDGEVYVVDNASADGSCRMVRERFPNVNLIENRENFGFSYANNQALRLAKGEFILVLNPDTVVEEATFATCVQFMRQNPQAGSLSVKMIDGKGRYLPESKRALPSPMVSFYKIFGLARLFPRSKTFARYHLGHLSPNSTCEIEILPGAFMFIRAQALAKAGLFDEAFFMYGEDIDLSYRILQAGYKNYYLPSTTIIHYKGESTKKGSINYVLVFYRAMMIFAQKHFNPQRASLYILIINLAIYFRAGISIASRLAKAIMLPILDIATIIIGLSIIIPVWEMHRFQSATSYPDGVVFTLTSIYVAIWIACLWMGGAYDRSQRYFTAAKGVAVGSIAILVIYALIPESLRFSRAIILLASVWSVILVQLIHWVVGLAQGYLTLPTKKNKKLVVVGSYNEAQRVMEIIGESLKGWELVGEVSPANKLQHKTQIGVLEQLPEIVRVNSVDEVIFCSLNISSQQIIMAMLALEPQGVDFKIAPPNSQSVIGSNSIDTSGDLYTVDFSAISNPRNRRHKRLFDVVMALIVLVLSPFFAPFSPAYRVMLSKTFHVIGGGYTWVGYMQGANICGLPIIAKGIFTPLMPKGKKTISTDQIDNLNILYAKSYKVQHDFNIIIETLKRGII